MAVARCLLDLVVALVPWVGVDVLLPVFSVGKGGVRIRIGIPPHAAPVNEAQATPADRVEEDGTVGSAKSCQILFSQARASFACGTSGNSRSAMAMPPALPKAWLVAF